MTAFEIRSIQPCWNLGFYTLPVAPVGQKTLMRKQVAGPHVSTWQTHAGMSHVGGTCWLKNESHTKIAVVSKAWTLTINVKGTCAGLLLYGTLFCLGEGRANITDKAKTMEHCSKIPAFARQQWVRCATFMHGYIIIWAVVASSVHSM